MIKNCTHRKLTDIPLKEWYVIIREWAVPANLGILPEERQGPQNIRIEIRCHITAPQPRDAPTCEEVVCYDEIKQGVLALIDGRHFFLMESLAEEIAAHCLKDVRVRDVCVRVEKSENPVFCVELMREQTLPLTTSN